MTFSQQQRRRRIVAIGVAVALLSVAAAAGQPTSMEDLLHLWRFSSTDLRALEAKRAIVKPLDTSIRRELAYFGAVHIDGQPVRFVERFRDIERFEAGPGTHQIGRFSGRPTIEDLSSLTLPQGDVSALSACRPGACGLKLPAAAIARFQHEVNWSSPGAAARANEIVRETLLGLVRAYQIDGNTALGHNDDGQPPEVADQFGAMLAGGRQSPVPIPGLTSYLGDYPRGRPAGTQEFFYWSVVSFGLKPTIRVNHVIIYPLSLQSGGASYAIAIKQLYASHYLQAALDLRFLVDDGRSGDRRGFYLLSLTRSRVDGTSGLRGSLLRPIISRRARTAVGDYMEHVSQQFRPADARPVDGIRVCVSPGGAPACREAQ